MGVPFMVRMTKMLPSQRQNFKDKQRRLKTPRRGLYDKAFWKANVRRKHLEYENALRVF